MKTLFAHLLSFAIVALLVPAATHAQSNAILLTSFTNPVPENSGFFSASLAALGNNRVLVGSDHGGAFLFSTGGTLLRKFTVSDPAASGFGSPAVAVGEDRVLISAYSYGTTAQNGRAYLFSTNGTLQSTFTNPALATVQAFGLSAAAFGSDRVLIGGVPDLNKPAPHPGGVFLFRTNGTLLATFTNPTPAVGGAFGVSIATVGNNRVLVGSPESNTGATQAGVAYLFNTNGVLLFTFTNPVPVANDNFGAGVAAVGNDRVLISAVDYGAVGSGGAAYLFSINGTLLTTFTNPTPATYDYFGWSIAAVGSTRVLIGAYNDDTGAANAGSAYLFSTNGMLLNTFTNPTPANFDSFGWSVAAVGTDGVLIGALFEDAGALDAGAAYLYALPYPVLTIARRAEAVALKWLTPETGLTLQQADVLATSTVWSHATNAITITGRTNAAEQSTTGGTTNRFYRLRRM